MRRRARVDENHSVIASAFMARGWWVTSTAVVGDGFPDLLVAKRGRLLQIEVKDGAKSPSRRRLTPDEAEYHADLLAAGCPVRLVESEADVDAVDREDL